MTHPTLEQCRQAGISPGLPDTPEERERFEVYLCKSGIIRGGYAALYKIWRDRGQLAQAEADQLRAQVAALEAEVARLKEPVGLVWQSDLHSPYCDWTDEKHVIGYHIDARTPTSWRAQYRVIDSLFKLGHYKTKAEAKAACAAHHSARYREMQGK